MVLRLFLRIGFLIAALVVLKVGTSAVAAKGPECSGRSYEKRAEKAGMALGHGLLKKAYDLMLPCAEAGNPDSQLTVGLLIDSDEEGHIEQWSEDERDREALKWIRKAASNGLEEAIIEIANAYAYGWLGLPENSELERCWRGAIDDKTQIPQCLEKEGKPAE